MAKRVTLSDFQKMQAGELAADREQGAEAMAGLDPLSGSLVESAPTDMDVEATERLKAIGCGAMADKLDRVGKVLQGAERVARLEALELPDVNDITPREGILARLKTAAKEAGLAVSEQDLHDEADRRWASFSETRTVGAENGYRVYSDSAEATSGSSPTNEDVKQEAPAEHQYDVAPDGTISDWRQIATTRAESEPYEPTVHKVGENDERFSGGGTGDLPFTDPSKLIPTDGAFFNDRHKAAPELANLAEKLIDEHGFFERLRHCRIDYKWRRKGTNANGKRSIGKLERVSGIWSAYVPFNFVVWLAADTARMAAFTDRQVEAALFHQLAHIDQDAKGNWIRVGHDFEGFGAEVRVYGPWTEDLKIGSQAFSVAVQLGLDLDAEDDEDDEEEPDEPETSEEWGGQGADGLPIDDPLADDDL